MKVNTAALSGAALDWAVAKCEGFDSIEYERRRIATRHRRDDAQPRSYQPSTDWSQGGPLIEREKIELIPPVDENDLYWMAVWHQSDNGEAGIQEGPTPLIATMRCYVSSKLGDEVDVPESLL